MLNHIKSVIFDLDGTLVDSMWVWPQIDIDYLGSHGFQVPTDLPGTIDGMSFTETAAYFKERFHIPQSIEEIMLTWQDMAIEQYRHKVPLKPGVLEALSFFKKQGITMAIASSSTGSLIEAVLESHRIRDYFRCIVTSCQVSRGKPAPDVYLEAARQLGTPPENCLVFEDIIPGIQAGKAAGMTVCAVEDTYSLPQEKEKRALADHYIRSYTEIISGATKEDN
ncbi:MAG: HAD family phosphatase [Eubacteriales bacterium]|nr:HAD family phosphatase [Eubacteriales bacterium]